MTADKEPAAGQVEVYNLDPATTPGGMKVRWRVRTATGNEAERLEKQQNHAIINLLTWADQYLREHQEGNLRAEEKGVNVSRETAGNVTVMSPVRSRIRNEKPIIEKVHAA